MALPKHTRTWNLYVDGRGYAGVAEKVKLPKLEREMEEWRAAGMGGPIKLDFGNKGLELSFTLGEYNTDILALWGITDPSGIGARFLAAAGDGTTTDAIEIEVRGRFEALDFGDVEMKKMSKLDVTMPLTYYRYAVNGVTKIETDLLSGKESVNGTDLSEMFMKILGTTA